MAVLAISSHVVIGRVGLRAIAPALEAFAIPTHILPTVTLPWHPGHGPGTRSTNEGFNNLLADLASLEPGDLDGILTGYFCNADQVSSAAQFVRQMKAQDENLLYMCDPVLGDGSSLYVPQEVAEAIRDELVPLADILTPNVFELSWLTSTHIEDAEDAAVASHSLAPNARMVLASSVPADSDDHMTMVLTLPPKGGATESADTVEVQTMAHEQFDHAPKGTGDLMAAIMLALVLSGASPEDVLSRTTYVMFEMVGIANQIGSDVLPVEAALGELIADLLHADHDDEDDETDQLDLAFPEVDDDPAPSVH
ncbi:MAG: bifunctional hydroxymethylpyrimidine kinase/phosphomethylpyrimidine kinase [Pseudomonadota bacterium]